MVEIIFFGCWNNGFCNIEDGENGMSNVFKSLIKYDQDSSNPDRFYIIAGDNYYPEKYVEEIKIKDETIKNKIKYINKEKLLSGFNCLKLLDAPKWVLMGNHDLDLTRNTYEDTNINCWTTAEQLAIMYAHNLKESLIPDSRNLFYYNHIFKLIDKTIIIYLNTTLLTEDYLDFIDCNKFYYKNSGFARQSAGSLKKKYESHNSLLKQIKRFKEILKAIESRLLIENVIITGHDPIITAKYKEKKDKKKKKIKGGTTIQPELKRHISIASTDSHDKITSLLPEGVNFIYDIYNLFPNAKKKYYLCADTHFYQKSYLTIKRIATTSNKSVTKKSYKSRSKTRRHSIRQQNVLEITQIIVGTGGASLDNCPGKTLLDENNIVKINHKYKDTYNDLLVEMKFDINECKSEFGYLKLELENNMITDTFISS